MKVAVRNAADEKQTKRAGRKDQSRAEQELEDLRSILQGPVGRRFIYRVLEHTGLYESSFTGNSETFFKEGKRSVGLWLIQQAEEADRRAFLQMLGEKIEPQGE